MKAFTSVVVALAVAACTNAYSTGAPESACKDMIPRHPVPPQSSSPPYTITTSTKVVKAGTPIEVVISGKDKTNTIAGLLMQARQGATPVGTFQIPLPNDYSQLLDCGTPGNAVTHKKRASKEDKQALTYIWTPPADLNDVIKFRATVAYNGAVFWVGVESAPIKVVP